MSTISGIPRSQTDAELASSAEVFAQELLEMHVIGVQGSAQRLIDGTDLGEPIPGALATWADLQSQYLRPSQNHLRMGIAEADKLDNSLMFQNVAQALEAHADTFIPVSFYDEFDPLKDVDLADERLKRGDGFDLVLAKETVKCVELVAILALHEVVAYEDTAALRYAMKALMKLRENLGTAQTLSGRAFLDVMEFLKQAMVVATVERMLEIEPQEAGHTKDLYDEYIEIFMIHARATGERATGL